MELEKIFNKEIINAIPVNDDNGKMIPYKRTDLFKIAAKAKRLGKHYIYIKRDGNVIKETEPIFEYTCRLSQEQYEKLIKNYILIKREK